MTGYTDRNLFFVAVLLYGLSLIYTVFLMRKGFREDDRLNYFILLAGFGFHTVAMFMRGISQARCPINNIYEATVFILWTMVTAYLAVGAWHRFRFLGAFASPLLFIAGVFALMPKLDEPQGTQASFTGGWTSLHATLILLAYGAFGLGSVASAMYLSQEHNLKYRKLRAVLSLMPPIQRLERITRNMLTTGLLLLTWGLAVGAFRLKPPEGVTYWNDSKVQWSIFVWLMYAAVLVLYWFFARRGRKLAFGAIGGFAFVLLTFWGFNLLSRIHNP